jgi:dnd system-associated protein 4
MSRLDDRKWLGVNVNRDRKHEPLVEKLTQSDHVIFSHNKDLMVFSAMVGYSHDKFEPVSSDKIQITLGTYANTEQDTYIYLLALLDKKDATCLKYENLNDSVKVFEGYCNAGLSIIQSWMDENPGDPTGIDTLEKKIIEQALRNEQRSQQNLDNDNLEVDF